MNQYQPWIGTTGTPVEPPDYHRMSDEEAEAFLREFVQRIPERISALEHFVRKTPRFSGWRADGSEESFRRLGPWAKQVVRIRPATRQDGRPVGLLSPRLSEKIVEAIQRDPPQLPWRYEEPVLATSVGTDVRIYTAQSLRLANPKLKWKRKRERRDMFYNHPCLTNRSFTYYPTAYGAPVYNLLDGSYDENRWWEGFTSSLERSFP
jgi:hypothetical protein